MKYLRLLLVTTCLATGLFAQTQDSMPASSQSPQAPTATTQPANSSQSSRFLAVVVSHKHVQERLDQFAADGYAVVFAGVIDREAVLAAVKSPDHHEYRWIRKTDDEYKTVLAAGFCIVPATFNATGFVMEKVPGEPVVHDYAFVTRDRSFNWSESMQTNLDEALAKGYVPIAVARSGTMVLMEKRSTASAAAEQYKVVGMSPMSSLWKTPGHFAKDFQLKLNELAAQGYGVFGVSGGVGFMAILQKTPEPKNYLVESSERNSFKPFGFFRRIEEKGFASAFANGYRPIPGGTIWLLQQYGSTRYPLAFLVMEENPVPANAEYRLTEEFASSKDGVVLASNDNIEVIGVLPTCCQPVLLYRRSTNVPEAGR